MTNPKQDQGAPFDGREFHNLDGAPAGRSLWDVVRWKLFGGGVVAWPEHPAPDAVVPELPDNLAPGEAAATFVGHSTFLLQFPGAVNVLTDPVWSERASPVRFAGPKRARPPALALEGPQKGGVGLPEISVVLISHGHYDHLDLDTLRRLEERFSPLFVTGLGNRAFLQKRGLRRVEELDWWQSFEEGGLRITFTPAQHWTSRTGATRNRTLWGGFWLTPNENKPSVYFAGDTGLGRHFEYIRERLGAPDVALLPIGAYEPRWFMREQHMNPDDAVQAHLALEVRRSVAMHFGTFRLTDEGIDQPKIDLAASLAARGVPAERFTVPRFGETLRF